MKEGREGGDQLQLLAASKVITLISCYQIGLDGYKAREGVREGATEGERENVLHAYLLFLLLLMPERHCLKDSVSVKNTTG